MSECIPSLALLAVEVSVAPAEEEEELRKDAERRFAKLSRMITHGFTTVGGDTPMVANIMSIREQYMHRKNWRANRPRGPGEFDREMAS